MQALLCVQVHEEGDGEEVGEGEEGTPAPAAHVTSAQLRDTFDARIVAPLPHPLRRGGSSLPSRTRMGCTASVRSVVPAPAPRCAPARTCLRVRGPAYCVCTCKGLLWFRRPPALPSLPPLAAMCAPFITVPRCCVVACSGGGVIASIALIPW